MVFNSLYIYNQFPQPNSEYLNNQTFFFVVVLNNPSTLFLCDSPPNPLATPPAGLSQVWVDQSHLLRFSHDTGNLTLTVRQNLRWSSEQCRHADILLLRERLRDVDFLREVSLHQVRRPHPVDWMHANKSKQSCFVTTRCANTHGNIQLPESRGTLHLSANGCSLLPLS